MVGNKAGLIGYVLRLSCPGVLQPTALCRGIKSNNFLKVTKAAFTRAI